jgi:peptidoglycan hydrolase CwlO-like protein
MSKLFWILILAGLITFSGCEQKAADRTPGKVTPEDVRRDAGQAVNTAAEYSQQTKDEFQKKFETQLNELDAKIAKLREKGGDLKDKTKVKWDQKMADLEKKREAARTKLAEVGHSSAEAWKDVQKGVASAWNDLDKAFQDASKEF